MPSWTDGLPEFLARFDAYAATHLTPWHADGCPDLPEQNLSLGPRYSMQGYGIPLSVFRGEGVILWALARAFHARRIAETYTGTGVAAVFLGAAVDGSGLVHTCDNYSEGDTGDVGWEQASSLVSHLQVPVILHRGGVETLGPHATYDLYFADGTLPILPARVTCIHDRIDYVAPFTFRIVGTSHLVVRCENAPDYQRAQTAVVDALAWLEEWHVRPNA